MTNTAETNTEHWCHVNRHKTFKVILLVAIVSVFVLGLQTGGFNGKFTFCLIIKTEI